MSETEDKALLEAAHRGERRALEDLWERHAPWLRAVILAHGTMGAESDDLLQEVAVTFIARFADVRSGAALPGWLRQVAINAARTAGRHSRRRQGWHPLGESDREVADPAEPRRLERSRQAERLERVLSEVERLPLELKEPLLMKTVDGLSQRNIAAILDLTECAVESRLARARRALRDRLPLGSPRREASLERKPR